MRMIVRAFALVLLIATIGIWAACGGEFAWTKKSILEGRADPAASAKSMGAHAGFVPGIEFLALGVGGAIVIFAATLFVRITPKD